MGFREVSVVEVREVLRAWLEGHDYAVRPEALETVAVLPIVVDDTPRALVYLCSRMQVPLGDRWFEGFGPMLRRIERDLAVDDEVRRRMAEMQLTESRQAARPGLTPADLRDIESELALLAMDTDDDSLRGRVESMRKRFTDAMGDAAESIPVSLSRREIEALEQVARGLSNNEVADTLGLLTNTVKTYVKTAMHKLNATNRVHATVLARDAGIIR